MGVIDPILPAVTDRITTVVAAVWLAAAVVTMALPIGIVTVAADEREPGGSVGSADCPIAVPDDPALTVGCGWLTVPENHDKPDGRQITLPYIVMGRAGRTAEPDPVVFTAGGPGYSSLSSVWAFAASPILDRRDIIVFEQRGNRFARPALICGPQAWWQEQPGDTACLDSLQNQGIDLAQYTTDNIVRDLIALRQTLEHRQWNLYGGSFSTSLMLLLMESDTAGTRSAILQSVKPPQETPFAHEADFPLRAIEHLFAVCAADEACAASYPELEDEFSALIRRLNRQPLAMTVTVAGSDDPIPIELDGDAFIDWVMIQELYQPVFGDFGATALPLLIHTAVGGRPEVLEAAARRYWSNVVADPNWAFGLLLAVNCQQDLPAAGDTRPAADVAASEKLDGFLRSSSQRAICRAWGLPPRPPASDHAISSDIPALVMAGSFDPVTPPAWSRATADHLANATYVEFPGHGHNVTMANSCAAELEAAFLDDPGADLDTDCVAGEPGPSFVLPGDVYVAPGLAASGGEVNIGGPQGVAWIEAVFVIGFLATAVALLVLLFLAALGLRQLYVDRRFAERGQPSLLVACGLSLFLALGVLALPLAMTAVHDHHATANVLTFAVGPRRDLPAATVLAWLTPSLAVGATILAALSARAWMTRSWPIAARAALTFTVLAALPILALGLRWDLYTML